MAYSFAYPSAPQNNFIYHTLDKLTASEFMSLEKYGMEFPETVTREMVSSTGERVARVYKIREKTENLASYDEVWDVEAVNVMIPNTAASGQWGKYGD